VRDLLRSRFVGMHELRTKLPQLLDALRNEASEMIITRQGKPTAVIIDIERYLEVQDALAEFADPAYLRELLAARQQIEQGAGVPAEEVFRKKGV